MQSVSTSQSNWFQRLYQELKHRRVMRVATLYLILCWPVIQVADILSPALDLPPEAMRNLLIVFAVGFPIALTLSWLFDLNRSGIVRSTGPSAEGDPLPMEPALVGRRVERSIIGLLIFVIMVLFYFQYWASPDRVLTTTSNSVISSAVPALAVLPFVTFSENREDQFFSDGLTEELLNVLSQLQNLRVIARTTSFAYKGVNKNVQDIGAELEVDTILEGSVRRNDIDNTIRVTAQLINVETGSHIWSQTFDREYRDVFKIQDEIAAAVVDQLQVSLLADEQGGIRSHDSANPEAMVFFSMGRAELAKRTQTSFEDAIRFFTRAVEADPQYADAYAQLAKTYALIFNYGDEIPEHLVKAEQAANRAVEIDPTAAGGWAAFGLIHMQRHEKDAAEQALQKALSFNPNHVMANMWLGQLQTDPKQRQAYHERAYALDPLSPVAGLNVATDFFESGRDAEAMDVFGQIIKADPYFPQAYELVARINESHGRLAAAIRHYERAIELDPRSQTSIQLANLYMDIGDFDKVDQWIDRAAASETEARSPDLQWLRIKALAARGDQAGARVQMRKMLDTTPSSFATSSNATVAAYFLDEPQLAIEAWELGQQLQVDANRPNDVMMGRGSWMFEGNLETPIAAAYAYSQAGRKTEADAVLTNLESWLDKQMSERARVNSEFWYVKAQILSIRGESNLALLHLQRAIDEGWHEHWRPFLEPCLADLLELDTFKSMMAGLAARMQLMGKQLEFDDLFAIGPQQSA